MKLCVYHYVNDLHTFMMVFSRNMATSA